MDLSGLDSIEDFEESSSMTSKTKSGGFGVNLGEELADFSQSSYKPFVSKKQENTESYKPSISHNFDEVDKRQDNETGTKQFFQTEDNALVMHAGTTMGVKHYLIVTGNQAGQVISGIELFPVDEETIFYAIKNLIK